MLTLDQITERREIFSAIKRGVVAIVSGHPEQRDNVGFTDIPASGLFEIIGTGFLIDRLGTIATAAHVVDQLVLRQQSAIRRGVAEPDALVAIVHAGFLDQRDGNWTVRFHTRYVHQSVTVRPFDIGYLNIGAVAVDHPLQPLQLADAPCEEGDSIAVCGFPHGLRLHNNATVNASFASGLVSAIIPGRDSPIHERRSIQFDAMVLGGTSGGPMFDIESGRVVGLVTSNYGEEKRLPIGSTDVTLRVPYSLSYAEDAYGISRTVASARQGWTSVPGSEDETTASLSADREAARTARAK